jgi:hypothetical protein
MSKFLTKGVILTAILGALLMAVMQLAKLAIPETLYLVILGYFGLTIFLFQSMLCDIFYGCRSNKNAGDLVFFSSIPLYKQGKPSGNGHVGICDLHQLYRSFEQYYY